MNEREAYAHRLLLRIFTVGAAVGPVPANFWDEMIPADTVLVEAVEAYEQGQIDRDELDSKATGYLNHWRSLCRT